MACGTRPVWDTFGPDDTPNVASHLNSLLIESGNLGIPTTRSAFQALSPTAVAVAVSKIILI